MFRSTLIAAGAVWMCGAASAQQTVSSTDIYPITAPVNYAGVYDVATKSWLTPTAASALRNATRVIYNNTCTWTGASFYTGTGSCETYFDGGMIPGGAGDPLAITIPTSTVDNLVDFFEIGYCTNFATGAVDIKVGFYDNLATTAAFDCFVVPVNPPPLAGQAAGAGAGYIDLGAPAGFPLPGDATPGGAGVTCWTAGIKPVPFCLQSDGNGVYDNVQNLDKFEWSWEMDNASVAGTAVSGIILSGEPSTSPVNGCTYTVPCGTDFFSLTPCGHGYNTADNFWINVDNDPVATPNTGVTCLSAPSAGTTCYWFGGYAGNPYASFWMRIGAAGSCSGCTSAVTPYCPQTAPTVTSGCTSSISASSATASIAAGAGSFVITASGLEDNKTGLLFAGATGAQAAIWSPQSMLCVKAPTQRTPATSTGGAGPCLGSNAVDFFAAFPGAVAGSAHITGLVVNVQQWTRDPAAVKTTNMSQALMFTLCP